MQEKSVLEKYGKHVLNHYYNGMSPESVVLGLLNKPYYEHINIYNKNYVIAPMLEVTVSESNTKYKSGSVLTSISKPWLISDNIEKSINALKKLDISKDNTKTVEIHQTIIPYAKENTKTIGIHSKDGINFFSKYKYKFNIEYLFNVSCALYCPEKPSYLYPITIGKYEKNIAHCIIPDLYEDEYPTYFKGMDRILDNYSQNIETAKISKKGKLDNHWLKSNFEQFSGGIFNIYNFQCYLYELLKDAKKTSESNNSDLGDLGLIEDELEESKNLYTQIAKDCRSYHIYNALGNCEILQTTIEALDLTWNGYMKDILCGLKATKDEMEKTGKNEDKSKDAIEAETKNFDRISKNLLTFMNYKSLTEFLSVRLLYPNTLTPLFTTIMNKHMTPTLTKSAEAIGMYISRTAYISTSDERDETARKNKIEQFISSIESKIVRFKNDPDELVSAVTTVSRGVGGNPWDSSTCGELVRAILNREVDTKVAALAIRAFLRCADYNKK